jgi:hypothetical protein
VPGGPLFFWAARGPGDWVIFKKKLGAGAFLKFSFFLGVLIKMADKRMRFFFLDELLKKIKSEKRFTQVNPRFLFLPKTKNKLI